MFLYTVFSGSIRKWVINDKSIGNVVFLFQLIVPFIFLLKGAKTKNVTRYGIFSFYIIILLIELFNPLSLTIFHGIIGFVLHISFWFATFFYFSNRNDFDLFKILNIFIIIAVSEVVLGFVQSQLPFEHFLNRYADLEAVGGTAALVGNAVRVCGTFSYISGYTAFLIFFLFLIWSLLRIGYNQFITATLYFLGVLAAMLSGSRGIGFVYLLFTTYFIFFEYKNIKLSEVLKSAFIPIIFLVLAFLWRGKIGIEDKIQNAYHNYVERAQSGVESGEQNSRVATELNSILHFKGNYPVFGIGLASTYQGANSLFGQSDYYKEYGFIESENEKIILEGGFVLFIFKVALIFSMVSVMQVSKTAKLFIAIMMLTVLSVSFNIYNIVFVFLGLALLDFSFYKNYALYEQGKKLIDEDIIV